MERPGLAACAIVAGLCSFGLFMVAVVLGDNGAHGLSDVIAHAVVPGFFVIWGVLYVILQIVYVLESMKSDDN